MFVYPLDVLKEVVLESNAQGAEFGSGIGEFSLALAKKLPKGTVYAIDVQKEPLLALEKRAQAQKLFNLKTIRRDLEEKNGSGLPESSLDIVLIPNMLFQVSDKKAVIQEAERVLKKGGQLLILDWRIESGMGPEKKMRISREKVLKLAEKRFVLKEEINAGSFHWAILLEKV